MKYIPEESRCAAVRKVKDRHATLRCSSWAVWRCSNGDSEYPSMTEELARVGRNLYYTR